MCETRKYNGWTNYETWAVMMWLESDEGESEYWNNRAHKLATDPEELTYRNEFMKDGQKLQQYQLSQELKDYCDNQLPILEGWAADILEAGFGSVDWDDMAKHLLYDNMEVNNEVAI